MIHNEYRKSLRVAFIGGGSGGHLFPAAAIAQQLLRQSPDSRFLFLTSQRPVDQQVLQSGEMSEIEADIAPYVSLRSDSTGLWRSALRLPSLWRSLRQARRRLKTFQPDVVVGLGALASVPGVVAASRLGLPVVLLEQNCLPGKATCALARRSRLTIFGLPVADSRLHCWPSPAKICGTPVRSSICELAEVPIMANPERKRILILGGSQGAHSVNQIAVSVFSERRPIPPGWDIVHQTGSVQVSRIRDQYLHLGITARVEAFLPDMGSELATAGIVISRAGAGTLQELACAGLPTILLPLSSAAGNHQMLNARLLEHSGAAFVIDEKHVHARDTVTSALALLIGEPDCRQRMAQKIRSFATPQAAREIVSLLFDVAAGKH